jgi:parvulin-like peptidyl-prolyl isomerase
MEVPMKFRQLWVAGLVVAVAVSLGLPLEAKEPDRIVVQHILIGFKDKVPGKELQRTKKAAGALALELFERAQTGEDFDALVKEYTDDRYPGKYQMTNKDVATRTDAIPRKKMVAKFGDIAFRLDIGEVGLAKYNAMTSPYGYHVIMRLE